MLHEESFVLAEQNEDIFSDPLQVAFSDQPNIKDVLKFQRRLILRVRKHMQLYDAKHELFRDLESKEKIWAKIATSLNTDVEKCKNTWADLRLQYQRYVRRLRKFLLYKNTQRKRRPIMALESELLFLWRYIPQNSYAPRPYMNSKNKNGTEEEDVEDDDDDVVMLEDEEPVVIILDDEEKTPANTPLTYKITPEMRKLLELIKDYPELYDHEHKYFNDYRRKGIIWAGIANETRDKATKLMKLWIQLQTRFEWELVRNKGPIWDDENDIRSIMKFLDPYILNNPNTVYKQSTYLKHLWFEPIDHFKNIYNLVATLKRFPKIVRETEDEIKFQKKNPSYVMFWSDLSRYRSEASAGQLEVTWLILRHFYWELMNMRKCSYQLQDKWYFESIITDLYETAKTSVSTPVGNNKKTSAGIPTSSTNTTEKLPMLPKTTLPVFNPIITSVNSSVSVVASSPVSNSITTTSNTQKMLLPKIVSAKSLATVMTTSQTIPKGLQITPVMPANAMTVVPTNGISLNNKQINNGYMTAPQRPIAMPKTANTSIPPTSQQSQVLQQKLHRLPITLSTVPSAPPVLSVSIVPTFSSAPPVFSMPTLSSSLPSVSTVSSTQPPQLSGPYPVPNIANVETMANIPNSISNFTPNTTSSADTTTFNSVQNKTPVFKIKPTNLGFRPQLQPFSTPTPTSSSSSSSSMPMILPLLPQVPLLGHFTSLSPTTSPPPMPTLTSSSSSSSSLLHTATSLPTGSSFTTGSSITTASLLPPSTVSQPSSSSLLAPALSTFNKRPDSQANNLQNIPPSLSNLQIPASIIPNPSYNRSKNPGTTAIVTVSEHSSALNGNEILIELISSTKGNQLIVHGPPLEDNFTMTMDQTAAFIREAMALPLLHNKKSSKSSRVQAYWVYLASKFNMPAHVCRAVWNFLSENFQHFSKIAPMDELMKPFNTEAKPWKIGTTMFNRFLDNFIRKGWFKYEQQLPFVLEKIGNQRSLYQDLTRGNKTPMNAMKIAEIWAKLREEYNIEEIEDIWAVFKGAFWQYMHDLETGMENRWPQRLWRCFSKLDFLIRHRYSTMEPYYYIVRNKFNEEVERCAELERKGCTPMPTFSLHGINTPQSYEIDPYNLLAAIRRHSDIYLVSTMEQKKSAWLSVAKELNTNVSACRLAFQRAFKNYRMFMFRDPASRCRLNHRYYKNIHSIYRSVKTAQKISIKTPTEVNQSVSDAPDPNDIIFPERMIFDINMDNSNPTLVLKNWAYGIGNCTPTVQSNLSAKITKIFEKYKTLS